MLKLAAVCVCVFVFSFFYFKDKRNTHTIVSPCKCLVTLLSCEIDEAAIEAAEKQRVIIIINSFNTQTRTHLEALT